MSVRTFAFKNRLFFIYTVVIVLVVALFSAVLLLTTINLNRSTELYHQQELYNKNLAEVETILRQMDRLASQIVSNNEILGTFIPLASDGDPENYFAKNLIDSIRVSSLLSSVNGADRLAARISVFNGNGDYVSTGTLYETPETIAQTLAGDYYDRMRDRVLAEESERVVLDFHGDRWSNNPGSRLISLYRALSSYTETVYGLVDIQVSAGVFDELVFWGNGATEYLLVNRDGEIVYPFSQALDANGLLQTLLNDMDAQPADLTMARGRVGNTPVIAMGALVKPSDWAFVRLLPERALLAPYTRTIAITAAACLVLLCCLVLVMRYLAARIAKPLQSLSETIAGINLQNIRRPPNGAIAYSTLELDALSRSFDAMLLRLDRSIAMELQAHMRALQSQMNPHFLFNMLSVIVESCEGTGAERTVSMCLKLSSMLRYIADLNGDSATLADELQHTRNYLDLMKDRYEDRFEYEIVAEGPVDAVMVPKMIVQPLAENCFTHGFQGCRPPWRVRVEVIAAANRWTLRVADNGVGITPEAVAVIHAQVNQYRSDVATNYKNLRVGGMGLVNTMLRLSLSQGEPFRFSINSDAEQGTVVEIGGTYVDTRADR